MTPFTKDLLWCLRRGQLTVGDLRWWFGRDYHTVREWTVHARQPTGAREKEAEKQVIKLRNNIADAYGFPIPLDLSKRERAQYMRLLGEGKLARARLLASRSPEHRVVRRIRKKGKPAKAVGVRKHRRTRGDAGEGRFTGL